MEQVCNVTLAARTAHAAMATKPRDVRRDYAGACLIALHDAAETMPTRPRVWIRDLDRADQLLLQDAVAEARDGLDRFEQLLLR